MKQVLSTLWRASKSHKPRLTAWAASLVIAGSLTVSPIGLAASASAQASRPTSVADCANWRSFGFENRSACVAFVNSNTNNNGYGGGGNGGGGSIGTIGRLIANIFSAIARLFQAIFSFFF